MSTQAIAGFLDGVTLNFDDDDLVESAVVVIKLRSAENGEVSVALAHTSDVDVVAQVGLLRAALTICEQPWRQRDDD